MKTEVVEAADRDVQKIVSGNTSSKNSTKSRKSRISILDNASGKGEKDFNATAL